jgi:hypothetical protein
LTVIHVTVSNRSRGGCLNYNFRLRLGFRLRLRLTLKLRLWSLSWEWFDGSFSNGGGGDRFLSGGGGRGGRGDGVDCQSGSLNVSDKGWSGSISAVDETRHLVFS